MFGKAVLILSAAVLFTPLLQSQTATARCSVPADEKAIRQVADDWKNAYNNGDHAKVASLYTEDAYYLTQHYATGIIHGRALIDAYVKKGTDANYKVDSIEVLATSCSGDQAYTITRYHSTNGADQAMGVNLVVLKRINGKWMIVAHEAAVPDPRNSIQHLDQPAKD